MSILLKIVTKLSEEEYKQFKVALKNFHEAKKQADNEKKIKYYRCLRSLFAKDLTFFAEIENFIQFTGVVKQSTSSASAVTAAGSNFQNPTPTKRKLDERN